MILIIFTALFSIVLLILLRYSLWRKRSFQRIPGNNLSLFNFLGDLIDLFVEKMNGKYDLHNSAMKVIGRWVERQKENKLFCIWFLYKPIVSFVKADAVKELLKDSKMYEKSPFYDTMKFVLGGGLVTSSTEKWKSRRKLLNPCFHHDMLKEYLEVFNIHSKKMVNFLKQETHKEYSVVKDHIARLILDIISETLFGFSIGALEDANSPYVHALERLGDIFMTRVFKVWLWPDFIFKFTKSYREIMDYGKIFHDLARSTFREKKKEYINKNKASCKSKRKALLDRLVMLHMESPEFSEDDAVEEAVTFILAGFETVTMTLTWALYLIGLHPDVQERIQEELDNIYSKDVDKYTTEDDLNDMNYLNCALMESNRIYSAVPIFARHALKDTIICGYTIPKGTNCIVLTYFLHRDENVFPDPERFDPDRFSPQNSIKIPDGAYVPFSAGPRNCIGQKFARMEMMSILSAILRNYTIESLDSSDKVLPVMSIHLVPSIPIRIRIRPRGISKS